MQSCMRSTRTDRSSQDAMAKTNVLPRAEYCPARADIEAATGVAVPARTAANARG